MYVCDMYEKPVALVFVSACTAPLTTRNWNCASERQNAICHEVTWMCSKKLVLPEMRLSERCARF